MCPLKALMPKHTLMTITRRFRASILSSRGRASANARIFATPLGSIGYSVNVTGVIIRGFLQPFRNSAQQDSVRTTRPRRCQRLQRSNSTLPTTPAAGPAQHARRPVQTRQTRLVTWRPRDPWQCRLSCGHRHARIMKPTFGQLHLFGLPLTLADACTLHFENTAQSTIQVCTWYIR